jgi:hypothetical protein
MLPCAIFVPNGTFLVLRTQGCKGEYPFSPLSFYKTSKTFTGTPEPQDLSMPLNISENSTASALKRYNDKGSEYSREFSCTKGALILGTSNGQNSQNDL